MELATRDTRIYFVKTNWQICKLQPVDLCYSRNKVRLHIMFLCFITILDFRWFEYSWKKNYFFIWKFSNKNKGIINWVNIIILKKELYKRISNHLLVWLIQLPHCGWLNRFILTGSNQCNITRIYYQPKNKMKFLKNCWLNPPTVKDTN